MAVEKVFMPPMAVPIRMPHRMRSSASKPPSAHATPAAASAYTGHMTAVSQTRQKQVCFKELMRWKLRRV